MNMKDRVGMNALHHAVAGGRAHCTAILLQSKADVRHTDDVNTFVFGLQLACFYFRLF